VHAKCPSQNVLATYWPFRSQKAGAVSGLDYLTETSDKLSEVSE